MKDPQNRTKVVLRHLPPSISQSALMEQIDGRFSGRYKWFSFRPGKNSQKNLRHSRAYIDFMRPEDVVEFAEFFDGHTFVNEKGTQIKALVEYAPSQRVPRVSKKDCREGTISKDPDYLEFLEFIAKPVENLPSAEIQLERREAERAGGSKEAVIVTPLMDFIRQKRAAKSGSQRLSSSGKVSRRVVGGASSSSSSSKRGSEKRRGPTSVYVLRDSAKASSTRKDKTYMLVQRKDDQHSVSGSRPEVSEDGTVTALNRSNPIASGSVEIGKRIVLLKGKEREPSRVSGASSQQLTATASVRNITGPTTSKQNQRQEASGRVIRTILSNKDMRQSQSEQQTQAVNTERDKRPPRPPNPRLILKDHIINSSTHSLEEKAAVSIGDRYERRMRNKDRPDRGVWAPRRSDGTHVSDDAALSAQQLSDSFEGISISQQTVGNDDMGFQSSHRSAESRSGRANFPPAENGAHRHGGRRGHTHGLKEGDGPVNFSEGKPSKRGVSAGYGSYERQVWVQKSGSGS